MHGAFSLGARLADHLGFALSRFNNKPQAQAHSGSEWIFGLDFVLAVMHYPFFAVPMKA
jgi:hypothetical protein